MKRLVLAVVTLAAFAFMTNGSMAQSKLALSVGADVLMPMGTFGDGAGIGFGGSVRGQYNFTPMFSAGLNLGYFMWSAKSVNGVDLPKFSGIPIRVFGKYYFMPEGEKVRVYGIAELGFFIVSIGERTYTFGNQTYTSPSASETDFSYAPGVGAEFGLGSGNTKLDVSVRYDAIATTGSTSGSLGARVGVLFPLGN